MVFNAFIIALREIRRNMMRAFLTMLGVVIGVAAVITMVTLGRGATEMVKSQISNLGSNLIVLRPGLGYSRGSLTAPQFSKADVRAIQDQIYGVKSIAPIDTSNVMVIYQQTARATDIQGTTPEYFAIGNWKIAAGRAFDAADVSKQAAVCVLGETVRKELFGKEDPIGQNIRLGSTSAVVIGVNASKGQGGFGEDLDDHIMLPITTLQRRISSRLSNQNINQVMISGEDGYPSASIVADVTSLMREQRGLGNNLQNNFTVIDARQIAEAVSSSTRVMTSLLGAVAGVSLLVGGIGIMNIMLVSVTERTREIGIRLAIGARAREVLLQFLIEAVTLSCVGGVTGILLAYGLCVNLAKEVGAPFLFDFKINLIAFMFSVAIGIIFGFMPARRAAALDPIEALRHE